MSSTELDSDLRLVYQHCIFKGVQLFALVGPPTTLVYSVYKRRFSFARWLRGSAFNVLMRA